MRKMSVIFFALAAVGCAVASGNPTSSERNGVVVVKTGEVFKVVYQMPQASTVKITILNDNDQEVFSEKIISTGKFIRPYNLSHLPKGNYKICVDDQNGRHVETQCNTESKEAGVVGVAHENGLIAHVVRLKNVDNKFLVSILQHGQADVEIHIYDQEQKLVYSEMQRLDGNFARVYALKNLDGATIGVVNQGKEKLFSVD